MDLSDTYKRKDYYTVKKLWQCVKQINRHGTTAVTGRAHCQRQVAFF